MKQNVREVDGTTHLLLTQDFLHKKNKRGTNEKAFAADLKPPLLLLVDVFELIPLLLSSL